jgi:signal transduction histidine kinase
MARSAKDGKQHKGKTEVDPSIFSKITRLIVSDTPIDTTLQAVVEQAVESTGAHRAFLAITEHDRGELAVRYTAGDGWSEEKKKLRLKVSEETGRGITSHVAATGWPHNSGDVKNDPYYILFFEDVVSEMAVPLLDADHRTRGVINIESTEKNAFDEKDEETLSALANLAVTAIVMSKHRAREAAVISIGKDLTKFSETQDLLQKIIDRTAEALRFEDCSLFLIDPVSGELVLRATRGTLDQQQGNAAYHLGEGLTGWVAKEGLPIRIQTPHNDPRLRGVHQEFPRDETGAFLAVPIYGLDRVLGVLRVLRKKSFYPWFPNDFTQDDESVLSIIASQVGVALENARLIDRLVRAERMAAWGEMSARSAHMIGNRVFAIKGDMDELEYLLGQSELDRKAVAEVIEGIKKGIFSLEEILAEFREFVMATQLNLEEHNLNDLVAQAANESFPRRSNVELKMDLQPDLPKILADPSKLKRSISELIENSINWQPNGGMLTLRTEIADLSKLKITSRAPVRNNYVQLTVEDKGPGVPEDHKSKIFNPFYSTRSKGMGLGLSIVKGIVEAHRGFILETGEAGKGARFLIVLPCLIESNEQPEESSRP